MPLRLQFRAIGPSKETLGNSLIYLDSWQMPDAGLDSGGIKVMSGRNFGIGWQGPRAE
jgi:hypothetical protein